MSKGQSKKAQDMIQEFDLRPEFAETVARLNSYTTKVNFLHFSASHSDKLDTRNGGERNS